MEQEKKKNNGLIVLVVILCLMVLGLAGYIVYDKVFPDKATDPTNNDTTNNQSAVDNTTNVPNNTANEKINRILFTYSTNKDLIYDFQVTQIDQLFVIFTTAKGKQCYPNNVTIVNNNGETIKEFKNVQFSYANDKITIESSNNGQCMGPDVVFSKTEYVVDGSKLLEQ